MNIENNKSPKLSNRSKISADFIFTKLTSVGGTLLSIAEYIKEKKVYGLYTELWFLGIFFFPLMFAYFFTKPKVTYDESNLYFKKFNTPEIQISFKKIFSISRDHFFGGRWIYSFEIEYLNESKEHKKLKFESDSYYLVSNFKDSVKSIKPSVIFEP